MPDAGEAFGVELVAAARQWIGTPFHWGAALRGVGCDCKGLLAGVARELGRPEAESFEAGFSGYGCHADPAALKAGMARLFDRVLVGAGTNVACGSMPPSAEPGDILLLTIGRHPRHLAIYTGLGRDGTARMIHTYGKGPQQVIEVPLGSGWADAVDSVWRFKSLARPPLAEAARG